MTIREKIECSTNKTKFTLYKEGVFYKCYNEDAMVFVQRVKEYKVNSKFVKSIGNDVLSLGFPVNKVEKGALSLEYISVKINSVSIEEKEKNIVFLLRDEHLKNGYQDWIETIKEEKIIEAAKEPSPIYKTTHDMATILSMIKNYDMANSTPMQGLGFIQELKLEVQRIEKSNGII